MGSISYGVSVVSSWIFCTAAGAYVVRRIGGIENKITCQRMATRHVQIKLKGWRICDSMTPQKPDVEV